MQPAVSEKPPWWLWPTILSLDAPAVAVLWQTLVARAAEVDLGTPARLVLGISVWLAYAADRWIEGWRLKEGQIRTHRHRFYIRCRWGVFIVWVAALGFDVTTAVCALTLREIGTGLVLFCAVAVYLFSHQLIHRANQWRAPKEACTALLLAGGAAVFVVSTPGASLAQTVVPLVLFALLCFTNCALISVWENEVDVSHGQTSMALQFAGAARLSRILPWFIAAAAAAAAIAGGFSVRESAACSLASALLLKAVDTAQPRIGRAMARVLADVVLLTPLVALVLSRGRP